MKALVTFVLLLNALMAQTYVKEYTYRAGEEDSKSSARKAALSHIQTEVVEENGIFIDTDIEQESKGESAEKKHTLSTFSSAITKTKILEEQWDGESFYIKAEITIDAQEAQQRLNTLVEKASLGSCESIEKRAYEYMYDLTTQEQVDKAVDFAVEFAINPCHAWHKKLIAHKINSKKYQSFVLDFALNDEHTFSDDLPLRIIDYLYSLSLIDEIQMVKIMSRMDEDSLHGSIKGIMQIKDIDKQKLLSEMFARVDKRAFGRPVGFKPVAVLRQTFYALQAEKGNTEYFVAYVTKYEKVLKAKGVYFKSLEQYFRFSKDAYASEVLDLIAAYFIQNKATSKQKYRIFVNMLRRQAQSNVDLRRQLTDFLEKTEEMNVKIMDLR